MQRLTDAAVQQQADTRLLDRELGSYKDQVLQPDIMKLEARLHLVKIISASMSQVSRLEVELSGLTLMQHQLELDKSKLLREADERNHKVTAQPDNMGQRSAQMGAASNTLFFRWRSCSSRFSLWSQRRSCFALGFKPPFRRNSATVRK